MIRSPRVAEALARRVEEALDLRSAWSYATPQEREQLAQLWVAAVINRTPGLPPHSPEEIALLRLELL